MGRIEDAMQRAGAEGPAAITTAAQKDAAFVAPWTFEAPEPTAERAAGEGMAPASRLIGDPIGNVASAFSSRWAERIITSKDASPVLVEQFRNLGAALHRLQGDGHVKVLMLTSAEPGEGKTLTAVNLALCLSESYRRRVLLVDADLRHPSIREISQISDRPGLSEGLKAKADQKLTVLRLTERLTLLPAGQPDPDPMGGLTSSRMRRIIDEAAARFDWVILDAPPVGPVADASLLAGMMDGTLLVVRAGITPAAAVQKAVEGIGRERLIGVVLNGVETIDGSEYGAYYHRRAGEPPRRLKLR